MKKTPHRKKFCLYGVVRASLYTTSVAAVLMMMMFEDCTASDMESCTCATSLSSFPQT